MTDTDAKIAELKEATRVANEALADIKQVLKDVKQIKAEVQAKLDNAFDAEIAEVVKAGLKDYQESLDKAIELGTEAVFKRFDDLAAIALGEDKTHRRKHGTTIPDLIKQKAELDASS